MALPVCLVLLALGAMAGERWERYASGPFEVITDGAHREARTLLNVLEQYRHGLGAVAGLDDLFPVWPVRITLRRDSRTPVSGGPAMGRDAWVATLPARAEMPRRWLTDVGRILLDSCPGRMPAAIEDGLLAVFSTLDVDGTRVTLGALPPERERTRDWARMHLLTVRPEYSGTVRVMLSNLRQGIDPEPAFRNAFGKSPAEIDKEVDAHIASGAALNRSLSGRALNPERDFRASPAGASLAAVLAADLLLADPAGEAGAQAAYAAVLKANPDWAEAHEGLGILALRRGDRAAARRHFERAVALGSRNARAHLETGAFEEASRLNPRWAEPHARRAAVEKDPGKKTQALETAARLAPREAAHWQALARWQLEQKRFPEASRSWLRAEHAAAGEAERRAVHAARMAIEQERIGAEAAERRRIALEKEREIQKLKDEAAARIREAEARANQAAGTRPFEGKVEPWWTDENAPDSKAAGTLERVDCLGSQLRLAVRTPSGMVQLLVRDPARVVIEGGGQRTLACGPQKPPRPVVVEYRKQAGARTATAGEVSSIEFR